jgi:hypothetical protein
MSIGVGATLSEKKVEKKETNSWISSFAVFGESVWALTFAFVLLLIAVGISFWLDTPGSSTSSDPYDKLGPLPSIDPPHIYHVPTDIAFTDEIMAAYKKDGVVAVRGLIGPELQPPDRNTSRATSKESRSNDRVSVSHRLPWCTFGIHQMLQISTG